MNMPKLKKKDRRGELEKEIQEIEKILRKTEVDTDDYDILLGKLDKLYSLSDKKRSSKKDMKLDPNTIAVIIGGLIEIGLIMSYENLHVITTKGFSRVIRPRI